MESEGIYYGATLLGGNDLVETLCKNKIELEYYGTEYHNIDEFEEKPYYGISIIKKEYNKDEIKFEKKHIENVSTSKNVISEIINILKQNKVTPICLYDVVDDLLKKSQYQSAR